MTTMDTLTKAIDAINRHDAKALAATFAQDAIGHDPYYPEPLKGRAAIEKDMADFFIAFPDLQATLGTVVENGPIIAAEFSMAGTHTGPLAAPDGEFPATGKSLRLEGAVFCRVNDQGEIVDQRRYYDTAGLLAQLGLAP